MQKRVRGDGANNDKIRRITVTEGFESICLMDRYLCRVPNPDPKEFKQYEPNALMEARKAYFKFRRTFESVGFSLPDVENITRIYLCSFLGLCKIEENPIKLKEFELKYQKKNNTTEKPPVDLLFKKNKSDLSNFLKQKLPMLASVCSRKSRNIVVDCEEAFFFKSKNLVEVNEEALKTAPAGYKGYIGISEDEFKDAQKKSKSRGKTRFFDGDYHYISLSRQPAPFFTLDKISEIDIEETEESPFTPHGIIEKDDINSLFYTFDNLPRIEKIELLEEFVRKNKGSKLVSVAKEILGAL